MPFEPKKLTREHVLLAVKEIEEDSLELTPSTQWDVIIDGKAYPPIEVLRYAHKQMNGEPIWDITEGDATNTYLDGFGFLIRAKNERADQIRSIIQEYKNTLDQAEFSHKNEKWYFVQNYRDKVDPSSPSFTEEFGSIRFANFLYPMASAVVKDILSKEPKRYQQCIVKLFQEEVDLSQRIQTFIQEIEAIYRQMYPESKESSHHDERTIATFLTLRYPNKYTFYMEKFYRKFCSLMGVKPMSRKGEKYVHYLKYIHEFTSQYVIADQELISIVSQYIPSDAFPDNDRLLLSQDIVFRLFGDSSTTVNEGIDVGEKDESSGLISNPIHANQTIAHPLNQILYGPPGTGKTYNSINLAVEIADPVFWSTITDKYKQRGEITRRYRELVKDGRIVFTTFHQSLSYEDFIEGIKPVTHKENNNSITYEVLPGIFKKLCDQAKPNDGSSFEESFMKLLNDLEAKPDDIMKLNRSANNNYVMIIDEINRGNVSQIFGELITLIEPDKRMGQKESLEVTLPYSKEKFSVPSNLYIIGTMNTADRSVEALDTALRRRFSFREMAPQYDLLESRSVEGINLGTLLQTINERIEALLDKDHAIGHSYFLNVGNDLANLKDVFFNEIIPLLQEYFYGNFGRIELVLGGGFVKSSTVTQSIFAKPSPNNDEFNDHIHYSLVSREEMDEAAFQKALKVLMNESDEA